MTLPRTYSSFFEKRYSLFSAKNKLGISVSMPLKGHRNNSLIDIRCYFSQVVKKENYCKKYSLKYFTNISGKMIIEILYEYTFMHYRLMRDRKCKKYTKTMDQ